MRAWDITRLIIVVSACIGIFQGGASIGLFKSTYFTPVQNQYVSYTVGDLNTSLASQTGMSISDYLNAIAWLVLSGLWVILNMFGAVVVLFPYLIWVFHMPWWFSGLLQVMIYLEYQAGIAQWRAGRQMRWIQ